MAYFNPTNTSRIQPCIRVLLLGRFDEIYSSVIVSGTSKPDRPIAVAYQEDVNIKHIIQPPQGETG